jgi:hypothetical protein
MDQAENLKCFENVMGSIEPEDGDWVMDGPCVIGRSPTNQPIPQN